MRTVECNYLDNANVPLILTNKVHHVMTKINRECKYNHAMLNSWMMEVRSVEEVIRKGYMLISY